MSASIHSQRTGYNFLDNAAIYTIESTLMGGVAPPHAPTEPNLVADLELYEEQGGNFVKIASAKAPYGSDDKRTTFVLQELLNYDLSAAIPTTPSSAFGMNADLFKKIMIKIADRYGSPPVTEAYVDGAEEKILHGGTRAIDNPYTLGDSYFVAHNYARSGAPRKYVHKSQPDWIYVFSKTTQTCEVRMKVYLDDGASYTHDIAVGVGSLNLTADKHQWIFASWDGYSMDAILQANLITALPYAFDMELTIDGDVITIPYRLEIRPHLWSEFILHYNCMSGFETIWLKGKRTFGFESSGEEIAKYNVPQSHTKKDFDTVLNFTRQQIQLNTGWQHGYAMDHLEQLFLGPCFWIKDGRFLPVSFERGSIDTRQDDEGQQFNVGLTMNMEWRNKFYNQL